jgi:hypothetical protein
MKKKNPSESSETKPVLTGALVKMIQAGEELKCRGCGCTNKRACPGGCSWIEKDLCDRCLAWSDNFTQREVQMLEWALRHLITDRSLVFVRGQDLIIRKLLGRVAPHVTRGGTR